MEVRPETDAPEAPASTELAGVTGASTLNQVVAHLHAHRDAGVECPACSQNVKVYPRKLNATLVRALSLAYAHSRTRPLHVPSTTVQGYALARAGGELARARYWGLLESATDPNGTASAGWWRVTEKGARFVCDALALPRVVDVYAGTVQGFHGPDVFARSCLGDRFDLAELLGFDPVGFEFNPPELDDQLALPFG